MITRIFTNAFARYIAAIVFACVLALISIPNASAADMYFDTRGEASLRCYAALSATRELSIQLYPNPPYRLDTEDCGGKGSSVFINSKAYYALGCSIRVGSATRVSCPDRYLYPDGATCDKEKSYTGALPWASYVGTVKNGSLGCRRGCDGFWSATGDGETGTWTPTGGNCPTDQKSNCANMGPSYYWNSILGVCSPHDIECPDGQVKDAGGSCKEACPAGTVLMSDGTCKSKQSECPAGNVKAPSGECLPGDGQCAAGEVKGKDGTCKRDSDGDGKPDAGEDEGTTAESFSGGDSCKSPPACSGSPILCGQARIQWRIDCNTRKNRNVAGGTCSTMPVCTGEKCDAVEYSSLLMQWRTACATEKLLARGSDNGNGDGGQPEWTKVGGMNQNPGAGETASDKPTLHDKKVTTDDFDQSGFGGGSCIGFASGGGSGVSSGFLSTLASPPPLWCNFINGLKAVFILCGAVAACFILARST